MITSKILSEQSGFNVLSIHEETWPSYLYGMLEFNDKIHEIEVESAINTYRALKEDAINEANNISLTEAETCALVEANNNSIKERLIRIINAIIEFVKKFIQMLTQKDIKVRNQFNRMKRMTARFEITEKRNQSYTFRVFHGPTLNEVDENACRNALTNITTQIDAICSNGQYADPGDSHIAMMYKLLARVLKGDRNQKSGEITDEASFKERVNTNVIYEERVEMPYYQWQNSISDITPTDKAIISKKMGNIRELLEEMQKKVDKASIIDEKAQKDANLYLGYIRRIVSTWSWYLNALYNQETKKLTYIINVYNKIKGNTFRNDAMSEAGTIHGEPFDSETLFGNEDMNDFNRTEWLDLGLTTECFQLKYDLDESLRRVALKEADIMSDDEFNKIGRLIAMREAEGEKAAGGIAGIFATIKKFIAEFFQKLKGKTGEVGAYIKQHSSIMQRDFQIESCSSKGDILAGIARLKQPINIVPFNYETMKEDLKDQNTFFEKHILPTLKDTSSVAKRKSTWEAGMKVADYCKIYFGASLPDDKAKPCVFSKTELNANKKMIIQFMNDPKILQSINTDLTKLEAEAKKVSTNMASAKPEENKGTGTNNTPNQNAQAQPADNKTATQESYFSVLYGKYITEAEITMSPEAKPAEGGQTSGGANNEQSAALKVYVETYKTVLFAKMTAAEFITSECKALITAHVNSYLGKAQQAPAANNQQPQQNQQQPQQGGPTQQQQ